MDTNTSKLNLGICMAGAVSAGAYTAGAMDYIIETLERWEREKIKIREKISNGKELTELEKAIPLHDVEIQLLSGASAGGMTAAILSYSLIDGTFLNKLKSSNDLIPENYSLPDENHSKSKLYSSWIDMADGKNSTTLDKLLDSSDVKSIMQMNALLNNGPIDQIAENALPKNIPEIIYTNFPNYISKNLSVFLTVTNLDGLPIEINFGNTKDTKNRFKMHTGMLSYSFSDRICPNFDYPTELISHQNYRNLITAAKSTGAFPVGLANQKVRIQNKYMYEYKNNLSSKYKIEINDVGFKGTDYEFIAVDGGLINNEPLGITAKYLNCINKNDLTNYLILIDPFPTVFVGGDEEKYKEPQKGNVFQVILGLFKAVRNHSMFKQEDLLEGLNMQKNKYLIYPSKRGRHFLACGFLGGFSGFFKKAFREHDYQLGRKNTQTFLRYYFGESISDFSKMNIDFNEFQKNIFGYFPDRDNTKALKLPLIPDMLLLKELSPNENQTFNKKGNNEITSPDFLGLTTSELDDIVSKIEVRIKKIIDKTYPDLIAENSNKWIKWSLLIFKRKIKQIISRNLIKKIQNILQDNFKPFVINQQDLLDHYSEHIKINGLLYEKRTGVTVKIANGGERIVTITSQGVETENTASKGDYIITNMTVKKEEYVIRKEKFDQLYQLIDESKGLYMKKNNVYALAFNRDTFPKLYEQYKENLIKNIVTFIEAPWKESQKLERLDFIVFDENNQEVYIVSHQEFLMTYKQK